MHAGETEHNRRRRFKVALAHRGQTATEWAAANAVSRVHLHKVLVGDRESQRLLDLIDAFVADAERDMAEAMAAA